jgi:hypothetical protein
MAEFGTPETWNMKVGDFIESELPKEKPQALLDLQEQNRKQRLLDSLQKIGPGLMDESLDFIRRKELSAGTAVPLAKFGMGAFEGQTFAKAKKAVQDAFKLLKSERVQKETDIPLKGTTGSTDDLRYMEKMGRETKVRPSVEYTGDTKFFNLFNDFKDSFFGGQVKGAAENLNLGGATAEANRVRVRKAFKNYEQPLVSGAKTRSVIEAPEDFIRLPDAKVKVKAEDKNYFKNIELPEGVKKSEYYTTDDLINILKIDPKDRALLSKDLNKFKAKKIKSGDLPKFQLGSTIDILTESGLRTPKVAGSDGGIKRFRDEQAIDPKYVDFFSTFTQRASKLGKDVDTFLPKAIESRGHAVDLSVSKKYPKLFKDSNADKFSSLVYQDPILNEKIFPKIGFGTKPEKEFKILEKLVGKKVTPEIQKQLLDAKNSFETYYQEALASIEDPRIAKQAIIESAKTYAKNKPPKKAKEIISKAQKVDLKYLDSYLKNQDKRIQKLNIDIPEVGETFKSENFFADLSNVDPAYVVGKITEINPNVLRMKELSPEELKVYQDNVTDQYQDYLSAFYRNVKTPQGQRVYSEGDIQDLMDAFDFGTGGQLEGTGEKARQALRDPVRFEKRKNYAEGTEPFIEDNFEEFLDEASAPPEEGLPPEAVAVGSLYGQKYAPQIAKGIGQALKVGASPTVAALYGLSELGEGNIKTAGASLLFPEIIKQAGIQSKILNPFNIGRFLTPTGLGILGLGIAKDYYDFARDEIDRINKMTPEEREQYNAEQQEQMGVAAAEGGRIGFADGPDDPSKRKFMKLMGILSLLPYGLGKLIKPAVKVAPVVSEGVKLGFDKFMMLVNKIKELGTPTSKVTQKEREVGYTYTGKDGSEYELVEDLTTGDLRVTKDKPGFTMSGDEAFDTIEDRSTFVLKKGQADETTKGKTPPDEYEEVKEVASPDGTFDDVDEISDTAVKEVLDEID